MSCRTAILLFSRSAEAEAAAKGFGGDGRCDLGVATALLRRTRTTLVRCGLPFFQVDETAQRGRNFGERLANATLDTFARGYDRLLVVGNDCPQLRPAHLRSAARYLAAGRNVVAPDGRGGTWMIGLQRAAFDASSFAALEWKTGELFGELTAYFGNAATLRPLRDVNRTAELRTHWWLFRHWLGGLCGLLFGGPRTATPIGSPATDTHVRPRRGRGPPAAIAA